MRKHEDAYITAALQAAAKQFSGEQAVEKFILHCLTTAEQKTIGRRLLIARLYLEGYSAAEIREVLQVSPNTLSAIRRWLDAEMSTYASTRTNKKKKQPRAKGWSATPPLSFARLRKQYPAHFLLFNLVAELRKPKR